MILRLRFLLSGKKIEELAVWSQLLSWKSAFLFEILDLCDTQNACPSMYDAVTVCSAIRRVMFCCV